MTNNCLHLDRDTLSKTHDRLRIRKVFFIIVMWRETIIYTLFNLHFSFLIIVKKVKLIFIVTKIMLLCCNSLHSDRNRLYIFTRILVNRLTMYLKQLTPTLAPILIEAWSTPGYTLPVPPEKPRLTLDTVMLRALGTADTGVMALWIWGSSC